MRPELIARIAIFLFVNWMFLAGSVTAQSMSWFEKIERLTRFPTTQGDVERDFPNSKITYQTPKDEISASDAKTKVIEYELSEGKLRLFLSAGKCSATNTKGWDLDEGVILSFRFSLNEPIDIKLFGIELGQLKASREDDVEIWFFTDEKRGVSYTVSQEKLNAISFSLPDRDVKPCKGK